MKKSIFAIAMLVALISCSKSDSDIDNTKDVTPYSYLTHSNSISNDYINGTTYYTYNKSDSIEVNYGIKADGANNKEFIYSLRLKNYDGVSLLLDSNKIAEHEWMNKYFDGFKKKFKTDILKSSLGIYTIEMRTYQKDAVAYGLSLEVFNVK